MTVSNYLLAVSKLTAEVADNPRLQPSFILIVAMMPKTLRELAGAARTKRFAA